MNALVFIPYQDVFDFSQTQMLTREYAMLKLLQDEFKNTRLICIGKPRTIIDKKKFNCSAFFPSHSIEKNIYDEIRNGDIIRYISPFILNMVIKRRGWWAEGYKRTFSMISDLPTEKVFVYCNNPYAWPLLEKLKEHNCIIFFDMMDNFAIHPSLTDSEKASAYLGYKKSFRVANYISCNSVQTQQYCQEQFGIQVSLIKNGVFKANPYENTNNVEELQIKEIKQRYRQTIGYVGKLGLRIDEKLIDNIASKCSDTALVFVGPHLKGQKNKKLLDVLENHKNVFMLGAIPSYNVLPVLSQFDALMIPHSVGKNENGGDPLKLYQYLASGKPIITTGILGVDEFKELITISNSSSEWVTFISGIESKKRKWYVAPNTIYWENRIEPLKKFIKEKIKNDLYKTD